MNTNTAPPGVPTQFVKLSFTGLRMVTNFATKSSPTVVMLSEEGERDPEWILTKLIALGKMAESVLPKYTDRTTPKAPFERPGERTLRTLQGKHESTDDFLSLLDKFEEESAKTNFVVGANA